jgi:hypothetical protein
MAGFRYHVDGTLRWPGGYGSYWSSTVNGGSSRSLVFFYSGSANAYMLDSYRAYGFSVRCLKD